MKTIRNNIFETNSSSTHSLSISSSPEIGEIIKDGVLDLSKLYAYKIELEESYIISASTIEEKIALTVAFLLSLEESDENISAYIDKIKTLYNISEIKPSTVYVYDEYGTCPEINELISVIDNPFKKIIYKVYKW